MDSVAPNPTRETFAALLARLYLAKHTGPVILHFAQGVPRVVEVPGEPELIILDKRDHRSALC